MIDAWEALHKRYSMEIILLLEEGGATTKSELTTFLSYDRKLLLLNLADLVDAGLVVSETDLGRRVHRLTPLGHAVAGHLRAIREAVA